MPSYTQAVLTNPEYLQDKSYSAMDDRKWFGDFLTEGIVGAGSFAVTLTGGLNISVAAGTAYILGKNVADQGMYRERETAAKALAVTASGGVNPRLDQVILRVLDTNAGDGSGASEGRIEIVPGVATAGATLVNRNGAANLTTLLESSKSVLLLADILVSTAGVLTMTDRRTAAAIGTANMAGGQKYTYGTMAAGPPAGAAQNDIWVATDVDANGVCWVFRYNAASASANKWEFIGGDPLYAEVLAADTTTSITYATLTNAGPAIAVPRIGDYDVGIGCVLDFAWTTSAAKFGYMSYDIGATGAVDADSIKGGCGGGGAAAGNVTGTGSRVRRKALTAVTLTAKYRVTNAATDFLTVSNRWMSLVPVRIQ